MTTTELCGLCGLPGSHVKGLDRPFFGGSADGVVLHHTVRDVVIDFGWGGLPVYATCYEAWTVYGHRPDGSRDGMAEHCYREGCWGWITGASDYCSPECERAWS